MFLVFLFLVFPFSFLCSALD